MLYPPSELENPLLLSSTQDNGDYASSASPLHHGVSCGAQDSLILRPTPAVATSFSWNDFDVPMVDHGVLHHFSTGSTSSLSLNSTRQHAMNDSDSNLISSDSEISLATSEGSLSQSSSQSHVSFAENLEVRTHSVVLGEHPFCTHLALELGWEHNDVVKVNMDANEHRKLEQGYHRERGLHARRRSYMERKQILKNVAGLSDADIRRSTLQHSAPSTWSLSAM